MFLSKLAIRRKDTWEDKERPLVGSVWFESPQGEEIKLNLDAETSEHIVTLCAAGIVRAAQKVGAILTEDMNNIKVLENKP